MNEERRGFQIMAFVREGMINSGQQLARPEEGGFKKKNSEFIAHTHNHTPHPVMSRSPKHNSIFFLLLLLLENLGNLAKKNFFFFAFSHKHKKLQKLLKSVIIKSTEKFRSH